ncbi:MAG TPA: Hpt domain-containing protein, partial [Thermoanaerobaculia bacterium]|nr:Hpt domain-containing protein [Thermoanaerobaculia bacterium]
MSDPVLEELRERFRETSRVRLQEMVPLLDAIDAESMRRLARHFHAFAGLGATYGFPRVSELGDEGEASILPL